MRARAAAILLVASMGCERPGVPLEGRRCPCLEAFVCCEATQTCHPPGEGPCAAGPPPERPLFVDRTGGSGLDGYTAGIGLTIADVDADGEWDLFFPSTSGNTRAYLFRGLGGFVFEDITGAWRDDLVEYAGTPADDFDGDGQVDLLALATRIATTRGRPTGLMLLNQGALAFSPVAQTGLLDYDRARGGLFMGAPVDIDGDGDADLVAARSTRDSPNPFPITVALNEGGALSEAPEQVDLRRVEGSTMALQVLSLGDYDRDGDPDVVACQYHLALLENDGGRLVDVTEQAGLPTDELGYECSTSAFVDIDGDGDLDIALVTDGTFGANLDRDDNRSGMVLYENRGAEGFLRLGLLEAPDAEFSCPVSSHTIPVPTLRAGASDAGFGDFDLDGDLDILLVRPFYGCVDVPVLYESLVAQGRTVYAPRPLAGLGPVGAMTSLALADLDADGDLDVAAQSWGESRWAVFENTAADGRDPTRRFLLVEAITDPDGDATDALDDDRRAQGVTVEIDLDGPDSNPDFAVGPGRLMARAISASGHAAQSAPVAHFGLGARTAPVWVRVRFADGTTVTERIVDFDRTVTLVDRP